MDYHVIITDWMRQVNQVLVEECIGIDHCISLLGRNLLVEVSKRDIEPVISTLKQFFPDVVNIRKAYAMLEDLHDFILVKPLISEAPLWMEDQVTVPSIEKRLVDGVADKEYTQKNLSVQVKTFQRAYEQFNINDSRLIRYASRKGKKEEVIRILERIDKSRIETIQALCRVLDSAPVLRAWIFGSFARMEERADSDLDLLVSLDNTVPMGLLGFSSLAEKLENSINRKVDLVAEGSLKPFAIDNVNRDKMLVYERTGKR
jgi:predicted nucleotidyltransferase